MASPFPPRPARLAVLVTLLVPLGQAGSAAAQLDHARDPGTVIVSMREMHGEVGGPDAGPSIAIHGDGSARVHYPPYMKRAGDYVTQLGAAELERLLLVLAEGEVLTFDAQATRHAKQTAARAANGGGGTRYVLLDASTTVIELHLNGVERTIRWTGLADDARRHPGIAALQGLAAVERELRTFMERQDLTRVEP